MKNLLYFSIFIFSTSFSFQDDQPESLVSHVRSHYAVNHYRNQNAPSTIDLKNILYNLLTLQDIKSAGKETLLDYLSKNSDSLILCSWYLTFGPGRLTSRLSIARYYYDIEDPISMLLPKKFFIALSQNKLNQARNFVEDRIPAQITQKINYLSPVLTQQDILDLTTVGTHAAIRRMVIDQNVNKSRIERTVVKALATQYLYNKTKHGLSALNEKIGVIDPNDPTIHAFAPLADPALYYGIKILVSKISAIIL